MRENVSTWGEREKWDELDCPVTLWTWWIYPWTAITLVFFAYTRTLDFFLNEKWMFSVIWATFGLQAFYLQHNAWDWFRKGRHKPLWSSTTQERISLGSWVKEPIPCEHGACFFNYHWWPFETLEWASLGMSQQTENGWDERWKVSVSLMTLLSHSVNQLCSLHWLLAFHHLR